MAPPPKPDPFPADSQREVDAGAVFVLESKGWALGFFCLTVMGMVTFYAYYLMSKVLDYCEKDGRRHIRFRELAADVLGSGWMFYFVIFIQTAINTGVGIGAILLAGECLQT
ncbi:Gaba transporter like [Populus alba x Populus x berolinensis]|nr:Gaba transporter like [Populus alba x Populus x berolinensis]